MIFYVYICAFCILLSIVSACVYVYLSVILNIIDKCFCFYAYECSQYVSLRSIWIPIFHVKTIFGPKLFPHNYFTLNTFLGTFKLYIELCFPGQKGTKICHERARSEVAAILIFTQISHNPIGWSKPLISLYCSKCYSIVANVRDSSISDPADRFILSFF